jgi:hypothetical protein
VQSKQASLTAVIQLKPQQGANNEPFQAVATCVNLTGAAAAAAAVAGFPPQTPRSSRTGSCSGRLSATGELEPQPELPCDTLPAPQPELPLPEIFLDGAFGAPTDAWNDYEVVTLIGAGMGVTPMASVLR